MASLLPWLPWLLISLLSVYLLDLLAHARRHLPPGPRPLPLIGSLHLLGDQPHRSLARLAKTHGPLMSLRLGAVTTVVVSSPDVAREFLQKHDIVFATRSVPDSLREHAASSVAWLPHAPRWRVLRKIMATELFAPHRLDALEHLRREKVQELVDHVGRLAREGAAVDLGRVAFTSSLNLLSRTMFSRDLTDLDDHVGSKEFQEVVTEIMEAAGSPNVSDFFPALAAADLQGWRRRLARLFARLHRLFDLEVDGRLRARDDGEPRKNDFLHVLLGLAARDDDTAGLDRDTLRSLFTKTTGRSRRARPRTPSPPPLEEVQEQGIDPRQLSPDIGDYGIDDQHMDETEGFEDAHVSTQAVGAGPAGATVHATGGSSGDRRAWCWLHMEYNIEMKDGRQVPYATCKYCHTKLSARSGGGTGHLKRHVLACLKKIELGRTQGGNVQTQLNFGPDGSDLFAAGSDTSSSTVEWAMVELLQNPLSMAKACDELARVIGSRRNIEESEIGQLPYLQAVVKETFRLHPPVPLLLPRQAETTIKIMGYTIPKGARVLVNVWTMGRDKDIWPEPEKFMPERFVERTADFRGGDFELIPFGAGRRICPGMPLAIRMVHLVLASLLNKFKWRLPIEVERNGIDMTEKFGVTLKKAMPLCATATPI